MAETDPADGKLQRQPAIEPTTYREAMSRFATGVTLVTALEPDGSLTGLTANAFSSVSLSPPMVLVCVDYKARAYRTLVSNRSFTIHFLTAHQEELAKDFARRGNNRSELCDWSVTDSGLPILSNFLVALECRIKNNYEGGDHAILVSNVMNTHVQRMDTDPLIFYEGSFKQIE